MLKTGFEPERDLDQIIEHLREPSAEGEEVRYPGQLTMATRSEDLARGIPVEPFIWRQVRRL